MIPAQRGDDGARRESPNATNAVKERFMRNIFENRRRRVVALVLLVLFSATFAASVGCRSGKSKSNQIETVDDFLSADKPAW